MQNYEKKTEYERKTTQFAFFLHFFLKTFGHIKKKQYLCTRFRKGSVRDVVQPG